MSNRNSDKDRTEPSGNAVSADKISFEEALGKWELALEADFEADRSAEQLGADDLAIRINAKA